LHQFLERCCSLRYWPSFTISYQGYWNCLTRILCSGSGPREREDLRDLVFIALLYGRPLIAVTYLAIRGRAGFTAIVLYLILVYISMIYMKIWHYQVPTSKEIVDQVLHEDLPASSRAGRLGMALIPINNLFIAWGALEERFKRNIASCDSKLNWAFQR
jgi:hypothetical protein